MRLVLVSVISLWLIEGCAAQTSQSQRFSGANADTVYILLDSAQPQIERILYYQVYKGDSLTSIHFTVAKPGAEGKKVPISFWHQKTHEEALAQGLGFDVRTYKKDAAFLSTISPLMYEWFSNSSMQQINNLFHFSFRHQPVIFIIDKADIKEGKLTLIQVVYHGPPGNK
ncbi:hypothetical protein [Cesiribacter andamanensis]|uniref:hypothetical protein n=1 Tax=Cesiribacter andamanensis TaxID=649507 RepID=UPI0013775D76|nr:hypothetical protein [Cesiribacter andamanensis]